MLQAVVLISYQEQSKPIFISKDNLYRKSTVGLKLFKNLPTTINPSFPAILEQQIISILHKHSYCWDNSLKYPFPEHVHIAFSNVCENENFISAEALRHQKLNSTCFFNCKNADPDAVK